MGGSRQQHNGTVASDGSITYVIFIYGDIQWGTRLATVGFNGGSRLRSYNLPDVNSFFLG